MRKKITLSASLLFIAAALISFVLIQPSTGPHGGVVKEAEGYKYNIEVKNTYPDIYVWLLTQNRGAVSNRGITCDVKFMFPDSSSIYTSLKPFGTDGFSLKGGALKFSMCRIYFRMQDKTITCRLENENPIAMRK